MSKATIGISALTLVMFSGLAVAQVGVPINGSVLPTYPQCWMWSPPDSDFPWTPDGRFVPVVRVNEANPNMGMPAGDPCGAALKARSIIAQRVTDGLLPAGKLAVVLQNFGHPVYSPTTSMYVAEDSVDANTSGDSDDDWTDTNNNSFDGPETDADIRKARFKTRQPWMTVGRVHAKDWMDTFLQTYTHASCTPGVIQDHVPFARFLLDHEYYLTGLGTSNYAYLLWAMAQEDDPTKLVLVNDGNGGFVYRNRWNTTPIPGFSSGTTMQSLWASTPSIWHTNLNYWDRDVGDPDKDLAAVDPRQGFHARGFINGNWVYNQDIFLWYQSVCERARDGALKEAAYDPVNAVFASCKTSNYLDVNVRAIEGSVNGLPTKSDFGWHQKGTLERSSTDSSDSSYIRESERGTPDTASHGYELPGISNGRWLVAQDQRTSASFSSPVLYAVGNVENVEQYPEETWWSKFKEHDPYRKNRPEDATQWDVSLRQHRHVLESIIDSYMTASVSNPPPGQRGWELTMPWVPMVHVGDGPYIGDRLKTKGYSLSDDQICQLLSLCKSKALPELVVWDDDNISPGDPNTASTPWYNEFKSVYSGVYDPTLSFYAKLYGNNTLVTTTYDRERLTQTNKRWQSVVGQSEPGYADYVVEIKHASPGGTTALLHTGLLVMIDNVGSIGDLVSDPNRLRIILECEVVLSGLPTELPPPGTPPDDFIPTLYGQIQLYNNVAHQWDTITINDESVSPDRYRFYAPMESPTNGTLSFKARRQFDLDVTDWNKYRTPAAGTDPGGRCQMRLHHFSTPPSWYAGGGVFASGVELHSKYDLVQLVRAPIGPTEGSSQAMAGISLTPQGPDFNFSGVLEAQDVDGFIGENTVGSLAGDYNNDGVVNDLDVDDFAADFIEQQ